MFVFFVFSRLGRNSIVDRRMPPQPFAPQTSTPTAKVHVCSSSNSSWTAGRACTPPLISGTAGRAGTTGHNEQAARTGLPFLAAPHEIII